MEIRADSWAASLTPEQSWLLYNKSLRCKWELAAAWAVKEFGLEKAPSRTAFYAWRNAMHDEEHEHRMEQAAMAAADAAALGEKVTKDEALIAAFKAIATEVALQTGDGKTTKAFIESAVKIQEKILETKELVLKERAQATKEADLSLAREKFEAAEKRLSAVQDAVKSAKTKGGLTEETLKKIEEAAGLL